ncbi:MAG: 50S ribosomal protein L25 [Myxococcales bacterium]|nr:50S ribosomal protein L25 [Myxococcales bacterium]
MEHVTVSAARRTEVGKGAARELRRQGLIPGVVYGGEGDAIELKLDPKQVVAILRSEKRTNTIVELDVDGTTAKTMVKDFQIDPLRRTLKHVDFYRLTPGKKVTVKVPMSYDNTLVVAKAGHQLRTFEREINIRCLPEEIPTAVSLDVSQIPLAKNFLIKDLQLPAGLEAVYKNNFALAFIKPVVIETKAVVAAAPVKGKKK